MSTENKVKRVRAPNWEIVEKKLLREVLANYVDTIENKCTDTNTNKRKMHAWQKVFERFNELNIRQRTSVELKQQWRMSKVEAKKIMSEHRIAKNKTGGGSRPPSPDEDTINLVKLLPLEFEVDHNRFDSDASQMEEHGVILHNNFDNVFDTNTTSQDENVTTPCNANTVQDSGLIETPKPPLKRNRKLFKKPYSANQKLSCDDLGSSASAKATMERLLWSRGKIMKANEGALTILQESTLANLRTIERNSRSIKDPNPLMSTLTNINGKFPITVRRDLLQTENVPPELYHNSVDNRRYNRILCKVELVQWYLHNVIVDVSETERSIIKLFDCNVAKYEKVFKYNWEQTSFRVGEVSLSRVLVSVNPNDIEIPKALVKPAILKTLKLSNMVEYNEVPNYYLNQVQKLVDNSNMDVRKIPNILNYLQNQIDKRFRYLPMINGMNPSFIYVSHALVQPQYKVQGIMEEHSGIKGQNKNVTEACMSMIKMCAETETSFTRLKMMVNHCKINDYPLSNILESTDENKYTKFVKGVVGMKISPSIEREGVTFYPKPTQILEVTLTNSVGTQFKRLNGEELVFFETNVNKGFFQHNADAILSITITRTQLKDIIFSLSQIAVFCTKRFEYTRSLTVKQMRMSIKRYYTEKFHELIGIPEREVRQIRMELSNPSLEDQVFGILRLADNVEIETPDSDNCLLRENGLYAVRSGQLICTAPFVTNYPRNDMSVKFTEPSLYHLMHPLRLLGKAVQINIHNIGPIKKQIRDGVFTPPFPDILVRHVAISQQKKVDGYFKKELREIVEGNRRNDLFVAVFYNFTLGSTMPLRIERVENFLYGTDKIHTNLREGVLVKDTELNLVCKGEIIVANMKRSLAGIESTCSVLPSYSISRITRFERGVPTKSIAWLNDNADLVPEGFKAITIYQTSMFLVQKVKMMTLNTIKTLNRHLEIGIEDDTSAALKRFLLKRKIDAMDSSNSDEASQRKRLCGSVLNL